MLQKLDQDQEPPDRPLARWWGGVADRFLSEAEHVGQGIMLWALTGRIRRDVNDIIMDDERPFSEGEIVQFRRHLTRELSGAYALARYQTMWQASEAKILDERLSRRFDPGMALNESYQRALAAKGELRYQYTQKQEAALKVQAETLRRTLRNS